MSELESLRREVARLGRSERRMELLLAVTGELAAARTSEEVARIAIDKGLEAVGASYGGLWAIDLEARQLRMLGISALPSGDARSWTVVALDGDGPLPQVARTGEAVFIESLADYQVRFPGSFERIRATVSSPDLAYAMLPVAADGPAIAALTMTYERTDQLEPGERTFLTILARQCGLALARVRMAEELARAYAEERDAHLDAKQATRARDELLSVVSHDLRNPLGTIMINASTLLSAAAAGDPSDPKAERIRTAGERIDHQARRMARLIEDLVDFARIDAGKLAISRAPHAPEAILAVASELVAPFVRERGLVFEAHSPPQLPSIECDVARTVQVFSNLVTTALKVTRTGGTIGIGARRDRDQVVFYVRDTGPGIDADEVPRVFERSARKPSGYRGAGLSIARGIVESHGGRIWAQSQPGTGNTFLFTLASPA